MLHIGATMRSEWCLVFVLVALLGRWQPAVSQVNDGTVGATTIKEPKYLSDMSSDEWKAFVEQGLRSVEQESRLEENLAKSEVTVENGTLSHVQLLETLPDAQVQHDNEVATKILKSSLYIYHSKCAPSGLDGQRCAAMLRRKELPENTELARQCANVLRTRREGFHPFRRLLRQHYSDGFHKMYAEEKLPSALSLSRTLCGRGASVGRELLDDNGVNLFVVQWAQFVEHDLSKPVATSMRNGLPIECCNRYNYKLQPRYNHPACEPLLQSDSSSQYGKDKCFNYVRSALAVGSSCTFGAAEQLNQATASLDLSQLYGCTAERQKDMRTYHDGMIRSVNNDSVQAALLPSVKRDSHLFCAAKPSDNSGRLDSAACFMAGDSRVNSNPFAIIIYTIFMRNHNLIASKLKALNASWPDEDLFQAAKAVNVAIYRNVVLHEWLPVVLGSPAPLEENARVQRSFRDRDRFVAGSQISNEFAVAAIRFYFSMMPNALHSSTPHSALSASQPLATTPGNGDGPFNHTIFLLENEIYKENSQFTPEKFNQILESLMHQRPMKMDEAYVESLVWESSDDKVPSHVDVLAFDIQRGRDHGVQPYARYLEMCSHVKITGWNDLLSVIPSEALTKLRSVYSSWNDIDLIVGGISEAPVVGSVVGPTFRCILAEQFSQIRQLQEDSALAANDMDEVLNWKHIRAAELLCINSELKQVPRNVFQLVSERNSLISCADILKRLKLF